MSDAGATGSPGRYFPHLRTVLAGLTVVGYLLGLAPLGLLYDVSTRQPSTQAEAHAMAHSGPAMAMLLLLALPFTLSLGGCLLAITVSIPGESARRLIPEASFTSGERSRLRFGGIFPVAGFLVSLLVLGVGNNAGPGGGGQLLTAFAILVLTAIVGFGSIWTALVLRSGPSNQWERPVALFYVLLGAGGIFGGVLVGIFVLGLLILAIPLTVAIAGYTRPDG